MPRDKKKRKLKQEQSILHDHNGSSIKKAKLKDNHIIENNSNNAASTSRVIKTENGVSGNEENNERKRKSKKKKHKLKFKNELVHDFEDKKMKPKKHKKKKSHKVKKEVIIIDDDNDNDVWPRQTKRNVDQWLSTQTRVKEIVPEQEICHNQEKKHKLKKKKRKSKNQVKQESQIGLENKKKSTNKKTKFNNEVEIVYANNTVETINHLKTDVNNQPTLITTQQNNDDLPSHVSTFAERFHSMISEKHKTTTSKSIAENQNSANKEDEYYLSTPFTSKKLPYQPIHLRKNLGQDLTLEMLSYEKFAQNNVMCRNIIDYNRDVNNLSMSNAKLDTPVYRYCSKNPPVDVFISDVEVSDEDDERNVQVNEPFLQFIRQPISDFNIKIFHPPENE